MRLFQLISGHLAFQKRLSDVEDAIAEIRRMVRSQDLDVSDALEKMQTLSARLAKRTRRGDSEGAPPPPGLDGMPNAAAVDPISARILARRAKMDQRRSLAEEAGDGLLPGR